MTGKEIAKLRERYALSQEALARLLGVSFATANRWESKTDSYPPKGLPEVVLIAMRRGIDSDPELPTKIDRTDQIIALATIFHAAAHPPKRKR